VYNGHGPVLSVVVLSYNFRGYLKECLDSVLAQKTDVPFEIIVADDASTDGSNALIRGYQECHPEKIRPLIQSINIGPKLNIAAALHSAKGEYIAYVDGDDLMSEYKLAKQVAFLEANPGCALVAHRMERMKRKRQQNKRSPVFPVQRDITNMDALCRFGYFTPTSSLMFRASAVPANGFPIYPCARSYDFCRAMILAQSGNIGLIHETLGTYRVHGSGRSRAAYKEIWRVYYGQRRALQVARRAGCSPDAYQIGLAKLQLRISLRYLGAGRYARFRKMIERSRRTRKLPGIRQWGGYYFRRFAPLLRSLRPIKDWLR